MTKKTKQKIEEMLERFQFVQWDRYTYDNGINTYSIYGWIDRELDQYKDFVILEFVVPEDNWYYTTSSAKRDPDIMQILGLKEKDTTSCIRVEDTFDIINSIHI